MRTLVQHAGAARTALTRLARAPIGTLLSALVIGIALSLPALGLVLADSGARLAQGVSGQPEISVFMAVGASAPQTAAVEAALRTDASVAALRFVPRDEALRHLAEGAGLGDVGAALGTNPLPDAFVLTPADSRPAVFAALRERIAALDGVAHVQLDTAWVQRLDAAIRLARSAVAALAALLGTALVIVTFNTIRLQILTQRHEIGVSLLLGATRPWVRRPYLWFGALQGAAGGLLAWALCEGVLALMRAPAQRLADAYGIPLELGGLAAGHTVTLLAFAAALGWLGAALSIRRHLHDRLITD